MNEENIKESELIPQIAEKKILDLSNQNEIDLSGLPDETRIELQKKFFEGQIENKQKAIELVVDVQAMGEKLNIMGEQTKVASESGATITITNTKEDSAGRTEIIMGNSEAAQKGKFTRSQQGKGCLLGSTLVFEIISRFSG